MSEYGNCPDCGGAIPCDCYAGCQDAPNPDSLAVIFPPTKPVAAQPDCRTCKFYAQDHGCWRVKDCTNGDKYEAAPAVVLWRTK
jgi:hypothetical protein